MLVSCYQRQSKWTHIQEHSTAFFVSLGPWRYPSIFTDNWAFQNSYPRIRAALCPKYETSGARSKKTSLKQCRSRFSFSTRHLQMEHVSLHHFYLVYSIFNWEEDGGIHGKMREEQVCIRSEKRGTLNLLPWSKSHRVEHATKDLGLSWQPVDMRLNHKIKCNLHSSLPSGELSPIERGWEDPVQNGVASRGKQLHVDLLWCILSQNEPCLI